MIVFIIASLNPSKVALFNKLNALQLPFTVYVLSKVAINRKWSMNELKIKFSHRFMRSIDLPIPDDSHSFFQLNFRVTEELKKDSPKIIISIGWNHIACYESFFYAKKYKIPYGIWSVSTVYEKSTQRKLALPFVKYIVSRSDFLISFGSRSKAYLQDLTSQDRKIYTAFNSIDNEFFIKQSQKSSRLLGGIHQKYAIKKKREKIVLYVGQFIKRKGIKLMLNLAKMLPNYIFLLVGHGPEEEYMRRFIKKNRLKNIRIAGYSKYKDLPLLYSISDLFILPSLEEAWGVVANEAMSIGKPVLVSKYAGSSVDLVKDGINGYVIDPNNIEDVIEKIKIIFSSEERSRKFGHNSLKIIKKVSFDQNFKILHQIYDEFTSSYRDTKSPLK